jgi:hypothetical protein
MIYVKITKGYYISHGKIIDIVLDYELLNNPFQPWSNTVRRKGKATNERTEASNKVSEEVFGLMGARHMVPGGCY